MHVVILGVLLPDADARGYFRGSASRTTMGVAVKLVSRGECIKHVLYDSLITGPAGVVVMSSANGMVGTGFSSRYRLQPREGF